MIWNQSSVGLHPVPLSVRRLPPSQRVAPKDRSDPNHHQPPNKHKSLTLDLVSACSECYGYAAAAAAPQVYPYPAPCYCPSCLPPPPCPGCPACPPPVCHLCLAGSVMAMPPHPSHQLPPDMMPTSLQRPSTLPGIQPLALSLEGRFDPGRTRHGHHHHPQHSTPVHMHPDPAYVAAAHQHTGFLLFYLCFI